MPTAEYKIKGKMIGGLIASWLGIKGPCDMKISLHPYAGDATVTVTTADPPEPEAPQPEAAPSPRPPKVLPTFVSSEVQHG